MKITVLTVGRGRARWADDACAEWLKRASARLPVDEQRLKPSSYAADVARARLDEATRILATLGGAERLVAVDERGESPGSEAFAKWIDEAAAAGTRRLVFAIGGPHGHGEPVRDQAWRSLALSTMVLNHEVARVVLIEQIYRATTILWGGGYHHA